MDLQPNPSAVHTPSTEPAPRAPAPAPAPVAPCGPAGPFGDELEADLSGAALRATVEYRRREGVAAHAQLHLPNHRARLHQCVGYGGSVLAELTRAPRGRGMHLWLTDLTQSSETPAQPAPPHVQRLGYGLTDALPTGLAGASWPARVLALNFDRLHRSTELLRAEFRPGDQRPSALVVRQLENAAATSGAGGPAGSRWQALWLGLEGVWQASTLGGHVDVRRLPALVLGRNLRAPQVLTNAGADDAGRCFVLVDGPQEFDLGPFGETPGVAIDFLLPFCAPRGHLADTPPLPAEQWLAAGSTGSAGTAGGARPTRTLSALACANNGTVAACLDGVVELRRGTPGEAGLRLPVPPSLRTCEGVRAVNLQLAAYGQLVAVTRRAERDGRERCRAELFALDFAGRAAVPVDLPLDAGVGGGWSAIALGTCDLDAVDLARLGSVGRRETAAWGGGRLVRSARRLQPPGPDGPRVQVRGAIAFANLTQYFCVEVNPSAQVSSARGHHALSVLAQTFPTHDGVAAARLDEFNDAMRRRLFGAGALGVVVAFDDMLHLYPRAYAEEDEERDNGLLRGGTKPLRVAETRPWVVAAAAKQNVALRPNRITLGPFMDRAGRFLFAGLDNNRLQRWDFAPEENGHLAPGKYEPQLQPADERPRTATFAVTPFSRHARTPFLGHFGPRTLPRANEGDTLPEVDPTPQHAYLALRTADRPRAPQTVVQAVGFGATAPQLGAPNDAPAALLAPLDLPSWGSGEFDLMDAASQGQLEVSTRTQLFNPRTFEASRPPVAPPPPPRPAARVQGLRVLFDGLALRGP